MIMLPNAINSTSVSNVNVRAQQAAFSMGTAMMDWNEGEYEKLNTYHNLKIQKTIY